MWGGCAPPRGLCLRERRTSFQIILKCVWARFLVSVMSESKVAFMSFISGFTSV